MRHFTTKRTARLVLALGALLLWATALAEPASAHADRNGRGQDRRVLRRVDPPRVDIEHFVVPHRMRPFEVYAFRPFHRGSVYHHGDRYRYEVYAFPVRTRYGMVYRTYFYRDGVLSTYRGLTYHGSSVEIGIRF